MPYFPMFVDLSGKPCLIVGGGAVAARKAEKLLPYGPRLRVVAPDISPELEAMPGVETLRRPYCPGDCRGMALVIAAADDTVLNRAVSEHCRAENIPVNVVDDKALCSFLFPSLVRQGELSVGISTGGASPTAAVWLRRQVEGLLPEGFDATLEWLEGVRPVVKARVPEEKRRGALFAELFQACLERGGPLTQEELEDFWEVNA